MDKKNESEYIYHAISQIEQTQEIQDKKIANIQAKIETLKKISDKTEESTKTSNVYWIYLSFVLLLILFYSTFRFN